MGQKDLGEKMLEDFNDVFSDIVNVLLYDGSPVISPDDLTEAGLSSQYKTDGGYHEQTRDVAKYWNQCGIRIAHCGIENQTGIDPDMPLRVISYDGGAYRSQLLKPSAEHAFEKQNSEKKYPGKVNGRSTQAGAIIRYPVITMVLYFGYRKRWTSPLRLVDRLTVPEVLKPYVSDYQLHIFEIAFLEREKIDLFKSDFRIVADYFWQKRHNKDYKAPGWKIKHVEAVLQMLAALTADNRFTEQVNSETFDREDMTICEFLDRIEARSEARGISIGEARGISIGKSEHEEEIRQLIARMRASGESPDKILDAVLAAK